jgi:hypothetical protein
LLVEKLGQIDLLFGHRILLKYPSAAPEARTQATELYTMEGPGTRFRPALGITLTLKYNSTSSAAGSNGGGRTITG